MTEKNWFYQIDGKHLGPLELKDLFDLYHQGQIQDETFLWRMGQQDWTPLRMIPEIYLALHPKSRPAGGGPALTAGAPPLEDLVRQTRAEIEKEIPTPQLETLSPVMGVPKMPPQFRLDPESGHSQEPPAFQSDNSSTAGNFDVPDAPLPPHALGVHERIEMMPAPKKPEEEIPEEEILEDKEMPASNVVEATTEADAAKTPLLHSSRVTSGMLVLAFICGALILSFTFVLALRLWQWHRPNLSQYPELTGAPENVMVFVPGGSDRLFIRTDRLGPEEGKVEFFSKPWHNSNHTNVELSLPVKQLGPWIIAEGLVSGNIPNGVYRLQFEMWSYDWMTRLVASMARLAPRWFGQTTVVESWRGEEHTSIGLVSANVDQTREAFKSKYEREVLSTLRESLLHLKTIQGLWGQLQGTFAESKLSKEFEAKYATTVAPVFQGISQDLQIQQKDSIAHKALLEVCRDFGAGVVLMSQWLQAQEQTLKLEAAKKIKPKKGKKLVLPAAPAKAPELIKDELQIVSAKIDGALLALQRDWEQQLQDKEIKD